jgi:hypothetical protein
MKSTAPYKEHKIRLRYIKNIEIPIAHLRALAVHVDNGEHARWQPARRYALTARDGTRSETGSETRIHVILTSVADPDPDSLGSVDPESVSFVPDLNPDPDRYSA